MEALGFPVAALQVVRAGVRVAVPVSAPQAVRAAFQAAVAVVIPPVSVPQVFPVAASPDLAFAKFATHPPLCDFVDFLVP